MVVWWCWTFVDGNFVICRKPSMLASLSACLQCVSKNHLKTLEPYETSRCSTPCTCDRSKQGKTVWNIRGSCDHCYTRTYQKRVKCPRQESLAFSTTCTRESSTGLPSILLPGHCQHMVTPIPTFLPSGKLT